MEIRRQVLARWPLTLDAAACGDNALVPGYLGPDHQLSDAIRRAYPHPGNPPHF